MWQSSPSFGDSVTPGPIYFICKEGTFYLSIVSPSLPLGEVCPLLSDLSHHFPPSYSVE